MAISNRTLKKDTNKCLKKAVSFDQFTFQRELQVEDVRILLDCNHSYVDDELTHRIRKQQVLEKYKLFHPEKYFGNDLSARSSPKSLTYRPLSSRLE